MLKTSPLGTYWQENSNGSSFTRVRYFSASGQAIPHTFSSWKKARAYSVPGVTTTGKNLPFHKRSLPVLISQNSKSSFDAEQTIELTGFQAEDESSKQSYNSITLEIDIALHEENKGDARLLVHTLDTEQNEKNSVELDGANHSSTESVELIMAKTSFTESYDSNQTCHSCGDILDPSDTVVVFDTDAYHMKCFNCGQCGSSVDPTLNFLVMEDGSPLCIKCSPMCHSCGEKILSGHVNVLKKDFHEECLRCSVCQKVFGTITKVYSTGGEPCCAECVTPVFNEAWSPRGSGKVPLPPVPCKEREMKSPNHQASNVNFSAGGNHSLPPRLESLSKAVNDLPSASFHSLLRPSFSVPSALSDSPKGTCHANRLSLSSLKAVLYDELGVSLLMNFCMEDCSIEFVVFWLDAEHYKHFDGNDDDIKLFARHIMLKYIGYYAELPINLPKEMEDEIVSGMQGDSCSQDLFSVAQEWVLNKMEKELQPRFLCSSDGLQYLEALVNRDINRRKKNKELKSQVSQPIKASVNSFDKRHLNTKFYVYEIKVEDGEEKFMIYRRYSEFYSLHRALKVQFPDFKLPAMPKKKYFGRSQTRSVAQERMKDLEVYLKRILSLPQEISQSDILQRFLLQTPSDKEDELFNSRIRDSPCS